MRQTFIVVSYVVSVSVFFLVYVPTKTRFEVKEGTLAILDGKILLPKDPYRIYGVLSEKPKVIEQYFVFAPYYIKLACQDGEFQVAVAAPLKILADQINREQLAADGPFDYSTFLREARGKIIQVIRETASQKPLHQLVGRRIDEFTFTVRGVPAFCNGLVNYIMTGQ
jgi:hypothetical protein